MHKGTVLFYLDLIAFPIFLAASDSESQCFSTTLNDKQFPPISYDDPAHVRNLE